MMPKTVGELKALLALLPDDMPLVCRQEREDGYVHRQDVHLTTRTQRQDLDDQLEIISIKQQILEIW